MKRVVLVIISIFIFACYNNVYAKDTVRSINKYNDESLEYILKGYNDKQEINGFVSAGTFLKETIKEENEYNDIQIMLVKYDKQGKLLWKYDYGKTKEDKLYYLTYSYNNENKINGYNIYVDKTYNKEEQQEQKIEIVRIDLKGKIIEEKELNLTNTILNKVIYSYNNENIIDGYIIVGQKDNIGFISKYDLSFNEIWTNNYNEDNSSIKDIILLRENNIPKEFITITTTTANNKVIRFNLEGNDPIPVKEDFEDKDNPRLTSIDNSYIIYGYTNEVKLSNDKNGSFYMIKYNSLYEEEWETIGNIPIDTNKLLEVYPIYNNDKLKEYMIMSTNSNDSSIEVTRINKDGIIENKVKKIKNDYYDISSFIFNDNSLYFIGQINCPEDDNCDYDSNSLFLISDEDKVIEVKEDDNSTILIVIGSIIVISIALYVYNYKKKKQI